jgi:predicted XRE-type DNA-binding protein
LADSDKEAYVLVVAGIEVLAEVGPNLGRPLVDRIKGSRLQNLKELRPGSAGSSELQVLFTFDPPVAEFDSAGGGRQVRQLVELVPAGNPSSRGPVRRVPEGTGIGGKGTEMAIKKWPDVREGHVEAAGSDVVAVRSAQMLARVRAHTLAEVRRRKGLTQKQVAEAMGVSVGRVSQIEHGDLSGLDVLDRYVHALGGQLGLVATFGDEQLKVG